MVSILAAFMSCKRKQSYDQETLVQISTHRNLGVAYLEENRMNDAQQQFQKLTSLAPDEAMPYANLGLALLRNNDLARAESELKKAIKLDSKNPDVRLILAEILKSAGRPKESLDQLKQALQQNPKHPRCNYRAAEILLQVGPKENTDAIKKHLEAVLEATPSSLPARLHLSEVLLQQNDTTAVMRHLEQIRRQVPGLTPQALNALQELLKELKEDKSSDANIKLRMLHNLLKPSPMYQQSIIDLNGPGGSSIGFPILHFNAKLTEMLGKEQVILKSLKFEKSESFGAAKSVPLAADLDSDGDSDLIIPQPFAIFKNERGKFIDITSKTGIKVQQQCRNGSAADYDNDSRLDLLLVCTTQSLLLQNQGNFVFQDVSRSLYGSGYGVFFQTDQMPGANSALWVDLDEDADLDLLLTHGLGSQFFRNNGDGSFGQFYESLQLPGKKMSGQQAHFADFDDDGDLDVLLTAPDGKLHLFSNERAGNYVDVTSHVGLDKAAGLVAIADYDNDGFLDLFAGPSFFKNRNGSFTKDSPTKDLPRSVAASFLDFDNDGRLDLAISNENKELRLIRNDRTDVSNLLPQRSRAEAILVDDFDGDGDEDLVIVNNGKLELLRNQGGNANHWINVRLAALAMESGKNNHYGIGAQVEIRADTLYQKKVVTQTVTHFGLGKRSKADVVRVTWNNGVPQNHFLPQANQTIVEKQVLKGSCPFLYAWNGKRYEFVTDLMWRSALGMPLGLLGASQTTRYSFSDSSDEFLKIPGNDMQPIDGEYRIQVTEELWETVFFDRTKLVVVDHPADVEIYVDEKFVVPPFPQLHIYPIRKKISPVSATDDAGANVLPELLHADERYVSGLRPTRYQGITELHDLILNPGSIPDRGRLLLFLKGWIFPTDASINIAISQTSNVRSAPPSLQVINKKGEWQTVFENISFPMGKNKMMILDLTGKFPTNDRRVRVRTNLQIYWDTAFFTIEESNVPMSLTHLAPTRADLHYRGFSKLYRKNDYGPHLFDYNDVDTKRRWRDLEGAYTRYGDVTSLLQDSDDRYIILNAGDEISIAFKASKVPPLKSGWKRDFLIYNDGWIKDGDLNTAYSKTVEPLPFQNMTQYPYGKEESYPGDEAHKQFLKSYNTRKVFYRRDSGPLR